MTNNLKIKSFLKIKKGIILRKRNCDFKQEIDILIRTKTDVFTLDNKIFNFLTYCNGLNDFNKIKNIYFNIFKKKINTPENIIKNKYLGRILENSFTRLPINKNQVIKVRGLKCSCRSAIWHLTSECNLNCKHCYYKGINIKSSDLNFNKNNIKKTVNNLHQLGVERVVITGGEVLLKNEELTYLCSLLTEKCLFFTINTNAFKEISPLLKIFKNNLYAEAIQVSLDGDKINHEKFRGCKGCYKLIYRHIKELVKAGINVKIVSMITNNWVGKEEKIFRIIKNLKVKEWLIEIPILVGRWRDNYLGLEVNSSQLVSISKNFIKLVNKGNNFLEKFTINQIYNWPEKQNFIDKKLSDPICFHDLGLITFGPEGVSFCTLFGNRFGDNLYKIAPAYSKDIKKIWNFIVGIKLKHKIGDNQYCRNCSLFKYCQGGCPGQYNDPIKFQGCDEQSRFLASIKKHLFNSSKNKHDR